MDQRVLREFLHERNAKLSAHFERMGLDLSMFTFNWILTLYLDAVPPPTAVRIWDVILYEGNKVRRHFLEHGADARTGGAQCLGAAAHAEDAATGVNGV